MGGNTGLNKVPLRDIVENISTVGRKDKYENIEYANDVFLPESPHLDALDHLPERSRTLRYLRLELTKQSAENSRFLVSFFNSRLGQMVRNSASVGAARRLNRRLLNDIDVYIPSLKLQPIALDVDQQLNTLQSEIENLRIALWSDPSKADSVKISLAKINHSDSIDEWINTLPFPLSSALVSVFAVSDPKDQYERLFHFFEATATFIATVHLSAIDHKPDMAIDLKSALSGYVDQISKRASFGNWVNIATKAAAELRSLMQNVEGHQLCQTLYATSNTRTVETLASKEISRILEKAVSRRNDWSGHTGIVNRPEAEKRLEQLLKLLSELKAALGSIWCEYQLLLPGSMEMTEDGRYEVDAGRATGPMYQFSRIPVSLTKGVVANQFQLWDEYETESLPLLQFVRMLPSTDLSDNACYFYDRTDTKGIRMVSHHYEPESEQHVGVDGDPISSAILRLTSET